MTTENITMEAPVLGSDGTADTSTPVEATTEQQDFATDEATLPTQDSTSEYQWVFDKYKDAEGNFDTNKAAEAYASLTKKLNDKGMLPPEAPDGYQFELGENPLLNDESINEARTAFHEMGLPSQYAEPLMKLYEQRVSEVMKAVEEMKGQDVTTTFTAEKAANALKDVWGENFNQELKLANTAIKTFYKGDLSENVELANNPVFAQIMAAVGRQLSEDSAPSNTPPAPSITDAEVEAIMARSDYWDQMADRESSVYKRMTAYFAER
jgi:hypothetical protein